MIIRNLKRYGVFLGIVVLPLVIAIIYYSFLARDRYVSTSQVAVHKVGAESGSAASQLPGFAMLLSGGSGSSYAETLYVREFILSQDMLNTLEKDIGWSQLYAGNLRDIFFYLPADASKEEKLKYYRRMVRAGFDETTGLLTVGVQAFDRDLAKKTLLSIIAESDRFVNEISHRLAREQVNFAESELDRARENFEAKRQSLLDFQAANNVLDAQKTAMNRGEVIAGLQAEQTKEDATLRGLRATLSEDSPQIRQQKIRIRALQQQIAAEERELVAKNATGQLNVIASKYHSLRIDAAISEEAYKSAVASLENARIEATKKLRSLVVVVNPNMPDESEFPRRLYDIFTILVILLLTYGVTHFIIATVKDHRD